MPQDSAVYAVARIRSRERTLLSRDTLTRMGESSAQEAWRMLMELGYGAMPDAAPLDSEALIENELMRTYELINEVTTNKRLTDIYLFSADTTNLKLLFKQRLINAKPGSIFARGGVFAPEELAKMVHAGDYSALPAQMAAAMQQAERLAAAGDIDPARISTVIDQGYFDTAFACGDKFTKAYFALMCDFDNLIAMARMAALGADEARLNTLLLNGGSVEHQAILCAYSTPREAWAKALSTGPAQAALKKALEEYALCGEAAALERARDNALMRMAAQGKNEIDTLAPIIGFLLAKRQEAKAVRLIMTALRNDLGAGVIAERMRILYGE